MSKKLDDHIKDTNKEWKSNVKEIFSDAMSENPEDFKIEKDTEFKPINISSISGKLISKKTAEGTLSAGVLYFILPNDTYKTRYAEVSVRKKTRLWQDDPQLHPFIDKMVKIKGDVIETKNTITVDCIEIEEL